MKSKLLVLVLSVVLAASGASADQKTVQDPRDEDQGMDPVEATHGHAEDLGGVLVHTVTADIPWADGDLYELEFRIWLPNRTKKWDRRIVVTSNAFDDESRSSWQALFYDKKGRIRGHANAWRPDDRSFRIEFSRRLLPLKFNNYRWVVRATVACKAPEDAQLCGGPKLDRVPDSGKVRHKL